MRANHVIALVLFAVAAVLYASVSLAWGLGALVLAVLVELAGWVILLDKRDDDDDRGPRRG